MAVCPLQKKEYIPVVLVHLLVFPLHTYDSLTGSVWIVSPNPAIFRVKVDNAPIDTQKWNAMEEGIREIFGLVATRVAIEQGKKFLEVVFVKQQIDGRLTDVVKSALRSRYLTKMTRFTARWTGYRRTNRSSNKPLL
jgi:hypothetical protein